jgi:hypothetical protein
MRLEGRRLQWTAERDSWYHSWRLRRVRANDGLLTLGAPCLVLRLHCNTPASVQAGV